MKYYSTFSFNCFPCKGYDYFSSRGPLRLLGFPDTVANVFFLVNDYEFNSWKRENEHI